MLDWERVSELRTELGETEFQVILEMSLDEIESVMMRLSDKDGRALETSLHFLKGCARNLGFSIFANLCDYEERKAAQKSHPIDLEELMRCYSDSKKAMMRGIEDVLRPSPRARKV